MASKYCGKCRWEGFFLHCSECKHGKMGDIKFFQKDLKDNFEAIYFLAPINDNFG